MKKLKETLSDSQAPLTFHLLFFAYFIHRTEILLKWAILTWKLLPFKATIGRELVIIRNVAGIKGFFGFNTS
jgi:hypothetical protein